MGTMKSLFCLLFLWTALIMSKLVSCVADNTIRIAAYDPNRPEYLPNKMMARRMGQGPRVIQDVIRPPRQAEPPSARRRLPLPIRFSQNQKKRSSIPRFETSGNQQVDSVDAILGPPLVLLDQQSLMNPHSPVSPPVGPPTLSTERSAFINGAVHPPSIFPPAAPNGGSIFGSHSILPSAPGFPGPPSFLPNTPLPPSPSLGLMPSIAGGFGSPAPPSPPTSMETGPPSTPPSAQTPAPPPGSDESQVTNIKCLKFGSTETFEAVLSLPKGYQAVPVFEDKPMLDPTTNQNCRMIPTQLIGMFQLIVSNYEACGVRMCRQSNGETWNCLILRFPRLNGLKLPEDEIIEIRCRPHDRTADDIHVLAVATAKYADKSGILNTKPPTVFEGLQEFECEIGLFRQLPGTLEFNTRVKEAPLDLGENVQLWSIIKEGDGWEHSLLSEVVIQKQDGARERSAKNTAVLVFSDGCRNPNYEVIAPKHPFRDSTNKLVNKFTFRAFLFQDMEPGDSLLISAKVIGCILEEDCKPSVCNDDGEVGYGRRRRSANDDMHEFQYSTTVTIPLQNSSSNGIGSHFKRNITDWSRDMSIKIRMPDDYIEQKLIEFEDCNLFLIISFSIVIFLCLLTVGLVMFVVFRRKKNLPPNVSLNFRSSTESLRKPKRTEQNRSISRTKEILTHKVSSSDSTTSSDLSSVAAPEFEHFPVPPTIRKRKSQVNSELLGLFANDSPIMAYGNPHHYPPMMNYYGYMVMPQPIVPSTVNKQQKKSVRALKRKERESIVPTVFENNARVPSTPTDLCSCKNMDEGNASEENHTSIIRINSSDTEEHLPKRNAHKRPKPKPRKRDPIYCEIKQNMIPTLV